MLQIYELIQSVNKRKSIILFAILFLYAFIQAFMLMYHELWRDEMQAWLLAVKSNSFMDIHNTIRYEGHPPLWFYILKFVSLFTSNPNSIKIVHWFIATLIAFIILFRTNFNLFLKLVILFGYYFSFEYSIISRNYSIGILFLLLAITTFKTKPTSLSSKVVISLFCVLAMLSNMFSLIIAISFLLIFCSDIFHPKSFSFKKYLIGFAGTIVLGFTLVLITSPPKDSENKTVGKLLSVVSNPELLIEKKPIIADYLYNLGNNYLLAFINIPNTSVNFWNTYLLTISYFTLFISIFLFILLCAFFFKDKKTFLFFIITNAMTAAFMITNISSYTRHIGHFYVILLISLLLIDFEKLSTLKKNLITLLFTISLPSTFVAFYYAYTQPFSAAELTSTYIKENKLDTLEIVAGRDFATSTISGFLNKDFYYPDSKLKGSYILWTEKRQNLPMDSIIQYAINQKKEMLLILNQKPTSIPEEFQALTSFEKSIVFDEIYYLYLVNSKK